MHFTAGAATLDGKTSRSTPVLGTVYTWHVGKTRKGGRFDIGCIETELSQYER